MPSITNLANVIVAIALTILVIIEIISIIKNKLGGKSVTSQVIMLAVTLLLLGFVLYVYRQEITFVTTGTSTLDRAHKAPVSILDLMLDALGIPK